MKTVDVARMENDEWSAWGRDKKEAARNGLER